MLEATKERPVIVLMDKHESHISVPAIRIAQENGIILVTLNPYTSNKLQPLDKSVFGPFKTYYNQAVNEKSMTPGNIGKPLNIYNIANLVGKASHAHSHQRIFRMGSKPQDFIH